LQTFIIDFVKIDFLHVRSKRLKRSWKEH